MTRKNQVAIILFSLAILYQFFPSWAKAGLFSNANDAYIGIEQAIMFATAIILFFLPDNRK